MRLAVVSRTHESLLRYALPVLDFIRLFDIVVSGDDTSYRRAGEREQVRALTLIVLSYIYHMLSHRWGVVVAAVRHEES